ncbi:MAG TPA: MBL fold metallo-hydrolase [Acidimicrobiales bacterium]|nr:MBL fold metallo-hydrolase [Acidimicrobiales bacterium]
MTEDTQRWQVGDVRITSVVEAQTDGIPPVFFFPDADEQLVRRHAWLVPHWAAHDGTISMRVQALVVEAGGRTFVVDPCIGNGKERSQPFWNDQAWPFMERFRKAGFDPDEVDAVVHTHVHVDHVGWDTRAVDGRWVPTFRRARHLYTQAELDWLGASDDADDRRIHADSVAPILDAGLADVVEPDADLGDGLRLAAAPGHTPGHTALWIASGGHQGLLTGDVIHHPVQCAEPDVGFVSDADSAQARATRRRLLRSATDADAVVVGAHFPTLPAGRVVAEGSAWRFVPDTEAP